MKRLVFIRGLPGSGKSTMAKKMIEDNGGGVHLEADMFFMNNGVYQFDPNKTREAHNWCRDALKLAIANSEKNSLIVISNTFVKFWELESYIDILDKFSKREEWVLEVINARGNYKSIHNVPEDVIARMKENWEYF